jgi:DNA-binding PadR family transcriptional regulator
MIRKRLALDFIELHILFHASEGEVYGLWMLEELGEHGYRLNPSHLYPRFHRLERRGLLKQRREVVEGKVRKYYRLTSRGRRYWSAQKRRLIELASEALSAGELRSALARER